VFWEQCGEVGRRGLVYIGRDGRMVDGVQRDGVRVQGFAIGQRGGGAACPKRARVFGAPPRTGTAGRATEGHRAESARQIAGPRMSSR
jgi:hypothetical protein